MTHPPTSAPIVLATPSCAAAVREVLPPDTPFHLLDDPSPQAHLSYSGPTLLVASKHEQEQILASLSSGVGDFILWPASPEELTLRLDALACRTPRDPLTGLADWRHRHHSFAATTGVLLADIDHFKQVNDHHGHHSGDRALRITARLLRRHTHHNDTPCRFGGDEFLTLTHNHHLLHANATNLCESLRQTAVMGQDGKPFHITLSIGVALAAEAAPLEHLIHCADRALYAAKAAGGDQVSVWTP